MAKDLKGTKTHENLKDAFAGESQANRRYLYFAKVADIEGYPEIAGNFRDTADGETGHAHGHLDYLQAGRRPGHGAPDRRHRREPQGVGRGRDPRVHRHVPGHGEDRPRGGLLRDRRLVRDARQGREVARRPLPEDARHHRLDASPPRRGRPSTPRDRPRRSRRSPKRAAHGDDHDHPHDKPISYQPTDGLSYDPEEPKLLGGRRRSQKEVTRDFEICHGCRMCFKYCDSFPILFDLDRQEARRRRPQAHRGRDGPGRWTPASSASCARCSARTRRATSTSSSSTSRSSCTATRRSGRSAGHPACATASSRTPTPPAPGPPQLRDGERHEPGERCTACSCRRRSGSTRTSCCPTSRPRTFEKWAETQRAHPAEAGRRRGGALPDLLRAEQRAPDRPRHPRGAGPQPGEDGLREGPAVLRHAGLGDGRPRLGAQAGGEQPADPEALRGRRGQGGRHQPDLRHDDAARVPGAPARGRCGPRRASSPSSCATPPSSSGRSARSPASTPTSSRRRAGRSPTTRPATCGRRRVGFKGRDLLRKIPGRPAEAHHGVLRPRRHVRDEGRRLREQHQGGAEGLRRA